MRRRLALVVALTVVASLAMSARSFGAVTIGVSLDQPSSGTVGSGGGATFVQTALPGGVNQSPIDGVAVRYRVQSNLWGDIRLRILRPAGGGAFDGVGTSATSTLGGAFDDLVHEFPARLPIATGDHIGIDTTGNARIRNNLPAGSTYGYWFPFLTDSAPPSVPTPTGAATTHAVLLNADIELDADKDGFGDETQDACPTDASTQAACPVAPVAAAPQAKKRCKKKRKKRGAKGAVAAKKKKCKRRKRRK